ncbi:MAG: hypothetical protein COV44_02385 [Deltaproteobacteria bacterium CG11_big_fil_rev_8_21_14_0_20_45_16]|nr:MAG: hypothetical protein COV44_02385 [Deltaproteobacteria bacterium CG11_big_fil_rev_8_21_14_0_20_45_16]
MIEALGIRQIVDRYPLNRESTARFVQKLRRWKAQLNQRYGHLSFFIQFGIVGFTGTIVNVAVLSFFQWLGVSLSIAVGAGIYVSMTTNFILNRWITFSYAKAKNLWRQYLGFVLASSLGALINYGAAMYLIVSFPFMEKWPQLAAVGGVLAGMFFNFLANRFWVFREHSK